LYGSETWSLTLKEEHRLRAFEYRLLRSGSDGLEKNKEENHTLYSSPNIIRMTKSRKMG
jgi:hypothetical protein